MKKREITAESLTGLRRYLQKEERERGTIEKYLRDVQDFKDWLAGGTVSKEAVIGWKEALRGRGYRPESVNSKLAALNKFFAYMNWPECRVKYLRVQRKLFRGREKELDREEYLRLVTAAESSGKTRLKLLMETICATGIRVSEVKYITAEAVRAGRAEVALKGKIRTILLPGKLCRKLEKYAKKQKTVSGEIFLTRNGKGLSRRQIWAEMKALCARAGVAPTKVFPHNLRHLFARTFYRTCRDVAKLADVLGHSSLETTRVYLISTGAEHTRVLERMELIL